MKLVIAALVIALAVNTAALAQYTFDAKGRRYKGQHFPPPIRRSDHGGRPEQQAQARKKPG